MSCTSYPFQALNHQQQSNQTLSSTNPKLTKNEPMTQKRRGRHPYFCIYWTSEAKFSVLTRGGVHNYVCGLVCLIGDCSTITFKPLIQLPWNLVGMLVIPIHLLSLYNSLFGKGFVEIWTNIETSRCLSSDIIHLTQATALYLFSFFYFVYRNELQVILVKSGI